MSKYEEAMEHVKVDDAMKQRILQNLEKELEYKRQAIDMMLECDNIHIYSFTMETDITADLDRYRDHAHYDEDVSSWIIEKIAEGENGREPSPFRITKDNEEEYLDAEKELLMNYMALKQT